MHLTVRSYKKEARDRALAAIERIAKEMAAAAGLPPERAPIVTVRKDEVCPAMYNNPELTKTAGRCLEENVRRRQRRDRRPHDGR
jgi:Metal-dependent amidase/aminoacylase/carboxypeptidase